MEQKVKWQNTRGKIILLVEKLVLITNIPMMLIIVFQNNKINEAFGVIPFIVGIIGIFNSTDTVNKEVNNRVISTKEVNQYMDEEIKKKLGKNSKWNIIIGLMVIIIGYLKYHIGK